MLGRSHITTGVCVGLLASSFEPNLQQIEPLTQGLFLIAVAIGSLLPDIDHPQSIISRQIPIIGGIIGRLVSHRGFFHSILGTVIVFSLLWVVRLDIASLFNATSETINLMWFGALIGYINHIVGDMITISGVKVFYPLRFNIGVPLIRTNSIGENLIVVIFMAFTFFIVRPENIL